MYSLVERPDGYYELQFDGKMKSCPFQTIFFYSHPQNPATMMTHKQPCCSDCSHFKIDKENKQFQITCGGDNTKFDAEIKQHSTLTIIN